MESDIISDEALIQQSIENIDHFSTLVQRYEKKLLAYILRISSFSREESEEILQEVFIKCWRNLYDFDPSLKFSSWIYRITYNETISQFRKQNRRGEIRQVSFETINQDLLPELLSDINISNEIDNHLSSTYVQNLLTQLSQKHRDILVLKFIEDKSYEEISDILQMPMGTVATNINRAKKKFQTLLLKETPNGQPL